MSNIWADQKWLEENNSDMVKGMAEMFGFNPNEWNVVHDVKIKGKSQAIHTFEVALESIRDHSMIPVLLLRELDEGKSEKIMLHRVKSTDISAATGYVVADFDLDAKEKALCEICNMKIIRVGPAGGYHNRKPLSFTLSHAPSSYPFEDPSIHGIQKRTPVKRHNRDRTKITQEILENVLYLEGASITQLIYKCNLNYKSAKTILNELILKELIKATEYEEGGVRYELTERGRKALERLRIYESV